MAKKGHVIIEGAKAFCSSAQVIKNKGTAVPIKVTSQKKKLGKNKYFAQEKPIATYLDDKAENFNNGQGFGMCQDPKNTSTGFSPCKERCSIKYKDYYENVDFNKSMKVLLDISTGTCEGYGVKGKIQFATSGQSNNISQLDIKEADEFSVTNASPQWEIKDPADKTKTSVSSISMSLPFPVADLKGQTFFYIQKTNVNSWSFLSTTVFTVSKLTLTAQYKGDVTKIIWTIFKEDGVKDKVKTFIGLGSTFNQDLDKTFENLDEGNYRIEAYGGKPGDPKCSINIEIVKDFVKKISIPASSIKNVPIPVTLERKVGSPLEINKVLNGSVLSATNQSVYWRIKEKETILYNSYSNTSSPNLVVVVKNASGALVTFKNKGKYTIEAFTNPNEAKPEFATVDIKDSLGIETIDYDSTSLRYNDNFSVWVKGYNAIYVPEGSFRTVHWYLKKEGIGRLPALENSASFRALKINKRIDEFLFHDAGITDGRYFGSYAIEAYATPLPAGKEPQFNGVDCLKFDVIKNFVDQLKIPVATVPKGTKVKYEAIPKISPLITGETVKIVVPQGVTDNGDGTLTFNELGDFKISAHLEGDYTNSTPKNETIKVAKPKLNRALWAYGTGVKRTETGYEEETYGFLEIEGLQNQALKVKIWVRGKEGDFYKEPDKYMLEEKSVNLNSEGKASFQITTNATYKEKIEKAIPKTTDKPNPECRLFFTVEIQPASVEGLTFPPNIVIEGTKPVSIQGGATALEVLALDEELTLTAEQKITKILFSTEDGKDIQRTITSSGKTHKLQVHTVNMQEEVLKVDILKEIATYQMQETDNIISALESVVSSKEGEKVGNDGLLEFSVTIKEDWLKNVPSFIYLIGQISQQFKDPADETKKIWKVVKAQYAINGQIPADIVTTEDKDKVGIKAVKKNGEAFTQAEMAELRKRFLQYNSSCLKVVKQVTKEEIENDVVPVVVEMAEAKKEKNCYCDRDFSEAELKDLIKTIKGSESIFNHRDCTIQDKSISKFTTAINSAFRKYNINKCIQKITFLAQAFHESDEFNTAEEYPSDNASSKSVYKGRGLIQMTGTKNKGETYYNRPGPYEAYGKYCGDKDKFVNNPNLISSDLFYAIDSSGWLWDVNKKSINYSKKSDVEAIRWKAEYFKDALGMTLNEIALVMENVDEDKYFYFQSKVLNGYSPKHKLEKDPNGWPQRKKYFGLLKTWFKYDKNVCKEGGVLPNIEGRAPWMKIVLQEAKEYGGKKQSVIQERVTLYHKEGANYDVGTDAWCSSFACWCLENSTPKFDSPHSAGSRSFINHKTVELCESFFGAIATFSDCNEKGITETSGHVTFVFGKLTDSKYAVLGGNQGGMIKVSSYDCSGNVFYSHYSVKRKRDIYKKFMGFFKPKGYKIKEIDKLTAEDNYSSPDKANKKIGLGQVKTISGEKDD